MIDRLITSVPVNRTAAKVMSKGVHWAPAKNLVRPDEMFQDTPLPTKPFPGYDPVFDLTGMKVCRLTVTGYAATQPRAKAPPARWVARCDCGMYSHFSSKFLRSDNAKTRGMCRQCDYLQRLTSGEMHKSQDAKR